MRRDREFARPRAPKREFQGLPEDPRDVLAREGGWKRPRRGPRPAPGAGGKLPEWAARKAGLKRGKATPRAASASAPGATPGETDAAVQAEAAEDVELKGVGADAADDLGPLDETASLEGDVEAGAEGVAADAAEGTETEAETEAETEGEGEGSEEPKPARARRAAARRGTVRLQKYLADAGIASRRGSEEYIRAGRVTVNGQVITELGTRMNPESDAVQVDGQPVRPLKKLYVALNKPVGYTCTRDDAHAAHKIGELLPAEWTSLYSVGRLDRESEGLLFLTNDGEFCLRLTHPRYGVRKLYRAVVAGMVSHEMISRFRQGVESEGETLRIEEGRVLSATRGESVVELELTEGRNREIRRLFATESMEVLQLQRTQIGSIKLGELKPGRWRTLTPEELKPLLAPS